MSAALFADVGNLYYCVGKRFNSQKLDYKKLYDKVVEVVGSQPKRLTAYGSQLTSEATTFIRRLEKIGYETRYRRPQFNKQKQIEKKVDWDVGICMDVVACVQRHDTIVLCSSDTDMIPLIRWVVDQGARCIVIGCGISTEIREVASKVLEITEDLLEEVKSDAKVA